LPVTDHLDVDLQKELVQDTSSDTVHFAGVDIIQGGSGDDLFHIQGTQNYQLYGNGGADTFLFTNGSKLNGLASGGAGLDILDYSAAGSNLTFHLTGEDATGFSGSENSTLSGFAGIDEIKAGSGKNALVGMNADSLYTIHAGKPALDVLVGGQTLQTTAITNLTGGSGNDTFAFEDGATIASLDGGAGFDSIDQSDYTTPITTTLSGLGTLDGFRGVSSGISSFTNIDRVEAGLGTPNQLNGINQPAQFDLNTTDWYSSNGRTLEFSGFNTLLGGNASDIFNLTGDQKFDLKGNDGDDHFVFNDGATLTGIIDGGYGTNTLDYSAYATPRNFILTGLGTLTGFAGTEASIIGTFDNIANLIGGSAEDSLTGMNVPSIWNITGTDGGTYAVGRRQTQFSFIENLIGNDNNDDFTVGRGVNFNGSLDGGNGIDTLDLSSAIDDLFVDLASGIVKDVTTGHLIISGGIAHFENLTGGAGNDHLIGDDADNVIFGNDGDDIIEGGKGNDTIAGGSGENWLYGDDGDDFFYADGYPDHVFGGDGYDTVQVFIGHRDMDFWDSIERFIYTYPPVVTLPTEIIPVRLILVNSGQRVDITGINDVILMMQNGDQAFIKAHVGELASLTRHSSGELPASLPSGTILVNDMQVGIWNLGNEIYALGPSSQRVQVAFAIPTWMQKLDFSILYWDVNANHGAGGWSEVKSSRSTSRYMDELFIIQRAWVDHTGLYALVEKKQTAPINCSKSLTLSLPNGDSVQVACQGGTEAEADLQAGMFWNISNLNSGDAYLSSMEVGVYKNGEALDGQAMRISFSVPSYVSNVDLFIRYWDTGKQAWTDVSGTRNGDRFEADVTHNGTYVLVMVPAVQSSVCSAGNQVIQLGDASASVNCQNGAKVQVWPVTDETLPEMLPFEARMISGMSVITTTDDPIGLSFKIPDGVSPTSLHLFKSDGKGMWLEVKDFSIKNSLVSASINDSGTYILVQR
jgi:RTX toxins and related Ca2+-binding proteins